MKNVYLLKIGVMRGERASFYDTQIYAKLTKLHEDVKGEAERLKAFEFKITPKGDSSEISYKYYDSRGKMTHKIYKAKKHEIIK